MGNYKGYFKDVRSCDQYCVYIIGDANSNAYTEILLSGNEPFVVRYDTNKTPFDPIRTSTASIKVVHNDYLEDIMTPVARSTQIKLKNETKNTWEWVGYLVPRVYDASYVNEYETFELEAADCLSSLQYVPYTDSTAYTKSITTIKSVIDKACNDCGLLDGYYWGRSKKVGNVVLLPNHLKISEQNWFYSDTDEPWDMLTIVEEICRYLGFTCLQWKSRLYFVDYQHMHNNDRFHVTWYSKASGYSAGSASYLDSATTVTAESYRATNASISFQPVYNKCVVRANMYTIDNIIPDLFGDEFLTNRIDPDNFYANYEVLPENPTKPDFPSRLGHYTSTYKKEKVDKREVDDADYRYFHRLYDHKFWESCYYDLSGNPKTNLSTAITSSSAITRDYMGATIVDLGVVKKEKVNEYGQWIVPNKLDYTRYLCCCCKYDPLNTKWQNSDHPAHSGPYELFKARTGAISPCVTSDNAYLVIDYSATWERYVNRAYINPDWIADECGKGALAAGTSERHIGNLNFKLRIGNKYWDGSQWSNNSSSTFSVVVERTADEIDVWNTELSVLNNVSWELFVNAEGYKIPLSGVTLTDDIEFTLLRPGYQFMYNTGSNNFIAYYHYNAYCWISDLSIKIVESGHEGDEENDIVYENVLNSDAVNELNDITVKLTTWSDLSKASYSTVIYSYNGTDMPLTAITEASLSNNAQKPEENIVEKYVSQYSTSTKEIKASLGLDISPFSKIKAIDIYEPNQGYTQVGTEIDYEMGTQTITMIEKK